jgi:hypothetical protein
MLVRFELLMDASPELPTDEIEVKKLRGITSLDRTRRFRSISLGEQEAATIFERTEDYLRTQLGAHLGKSH